MLSALRGKRRSVRAHSRRGLASVQLRNITSHAITSPERVRLRSVVQYQEEEAYMVFPEAAHLAAGG